jgi:pantothenate kinase type III
MLVDIGTFVTLDIVRSKRHIDGGILLVWKNAESVRG